MLVSKAALEKIRRIIQKNYYSLLVNVAGRNVLSAKELKELEDAGVDVSNNTSLLSLIYYHNVLNAPDSTTAPTSVEEMAAQQKVKPEAPMHRVAEEHLNENFAQLTDKIKASIQAGVEGTVREYNLGYRNEELNQAVQPEALGAAIREKTVGELKMSLRDLSHDGTRDWTRVAVTETSNALGLGSVDRVVTQNEGKDTKEIYVYRITSADGSTCKYCKRFYLDEDESPAVYRLATLLGNGTNYGRKADAWRPVATATHPQEKCSGVLQLRPGWKVIEGGRLEFMGQAKWAEYIEGKVRG